MTVWAVKITLNNSKVYPSQYTANNPGSALFLAWENLRSQIMVGSEDIKDCEILPKK